MFGLIRLDVVELMLNFEVEVKYRLECVCVRVCMRVILQLFILERMVPVLSFCT